MPVADRDRFVRKLPCAIGICLLLAAPLMLSSDAAANEPPALPQPADRVLPAVAQAEPAVEGASAGNDGPQLFVTDRVAVRRLRQAEERIANGSFNEAVELLQAVLDSQEDAAALAGEQDGSFYSLKRRALTLIADLPPDGRQVYELKYGTAAAGRLKQAVAAGDWSTIEAISRRFFYTQAGSEATYRLATRAQDRGEPLQAAVLFKTLADGNGRRYEPQLSFRTASAWAAAGFPEAAQAAADRFLSQDRDRFTLGGAPMPPFDDAGTLVALLARHFGTTHGDMRPAWPMFGRDADRAASIEPVTVAGGLEWSHRFDTPTPWDHPREANNVAKLSTALDTVTAIAGETGELTQPAFSPVVAGNVAVFRTLSSVQAVDLATGRFLWRTEHPHDVVFDRALDGINLFMQSGRPFGGAAHRGMFLEEYVSQYAWRNLTSGTLSTDGTFVYGVEGVGTAGVTVSAPSGGPRNEAIGNELFNTLYAYELAAEGRIAWTVGGAPEQPGSTGTYFLGPPLPLGGRLYALAERDGEIRLLALDPKTSDDDRRILWSQSLFGTELPIAANPPIFADPLRKLSGLSPSFSQGVLICPTGSGAVVAVDLGQRLLRWGYRYERNVHSRSGGAGRPVPFMAVPPSAAPDDKVDRWLDSAAQIANGRVYVTPRDSDELHCIDLRDGRLLWKKPRESMLYLASVDSQRAIVVGRDAVQSLDAETGEVEWTQLLDAAEPAGRGVRSEELYLLPMDTGEIVTMHLATGQELGRSPIGDDMRPGNLIAANGRLLMQSTAALAGFRQLADFESELRDRLTERSDPGMLALRGEHRLHRGETQAALDDLKRAAEAADLPRARRLLTAALLEGLRTDFATFRHYEADLLRYADDPRQRLEFLRLFATGLERADEPLAAFRTYLRLCDRSGAALPLEAMPLENGRDETLVRTDRALRLRIASLYNSASEHERRAMDALLERQLSDLKQDGDTETIERFASLFRETSIAQSALAAVAAGHEANDNPLRAEQAYLWLDELSNPRTMISASPELGTGTETLDGRFDSAYQTTYLPDEIRSGRPLTQVETRFTVPVIGPRPTDFSGWRFDIDSQREFLQARDPLARLRWKVNVRPKEDSDTPLRYAHAGQVRFCGHIMAFAAGTRLVVFDLMTPGQPRLLWSRDLLDRRLGDLTINRQRFRQLASNQAYGPIGFAGAGQLLYQAGRQLVATDPLTGETLWQRSRIPPGCEISGDGEFVVLHPIDEQDVYLLRTVDGSRVGDGSVQAISEDDAVGWVGTRLVSWKPDDEKCELICRDLARSEDAWSWSFPPTAKFDRLGDHEIVVLDPPTGKIQVIDLLDGDLVFTAQIDPNPDIDFVSLRCYEQLLVFTRPDRGRQARRDRPESEWQTIEGLAYAFDDDGTRLWSSILPRQRLSTESSTGLPVLFLTNSVRTRGRSETYHAAILDVRTGRLLIEQQREREFLPCEMQVDSGTGTLTIAVPDARFVLTPLENQLPSALHDAPAAPADSPGE